MNLLFILTFFPPLLILLYVIKSDKFPEPISCILKIFTLGIFLTIPAGYLNQILIFNSEEDLTYLAGLTEESLKFFAFLFFVSKSFNFNERMDAIVYGVLISLGFATLENYQYVYFLFPDVDSHTVAIFRVFTAIPLHAFCGVIMGYYFGLHYFDHKPHYLFLAFFIPVITHAIYNFSGDIALQFLIIIILSFQVKKLHRQFIKHQSNKKTEAEIKLL